MNGAIYALRKSAFITVPLHVPNDFFHPLCVLATGRKVTFEPTAIASEKATESGAEEFSRRSRIVTRALATYDEVKKVVGPLKGHAKFNYISHRLLRWYGFVPLLVSFLSASTLALFAQSVFFKTILIIMGVSMFFCLIGWISNRFKIKVKYMEIPYYFFLINAAAASGIIRHLKGGKISKWNSAQSTR